MFQKTTEKKKGEGRDRRRKERRKNGKNKCKSTDLRGLTVPKRSGHKGRCIQRQRINQSKKLK